MSVTKVIDGLVRLGAKVVHSGIEDVHATGHAKQEEIKTLLSIVEPQWFIPVHGEYRHLVHHAELAQTMGVAAERTLVCEDGDQITIDDDGIRISGQVPAGYLYVDGIVGDVGQGVLRDRRVLAEEGVVVVVVTVSTADGAILTGPEVITRGWVYAPEAEELLDECAGGRARRPSRRPSPTTTPDLEALQRVVRRAAGRFVSDRTTPQADDRPRRHGGVGEPAVPELPEVETVRRELEPLVVGRRVVEGWGHPSAKFSSAPLAAGPSIESVGRRGKYLLLGLDDERELVVHLGMTGQLRMRPIGRRRPVRAGLVGPRRPARSSSCATSAASAASAWCRRGSTRRCPRSPRRARSPGTPRSTTAGCGGPCAAARRG